MDGEPLFPDLYLAVGEAISCWVGVEIKLCELLAVVAAPTQSAALDAALLQVRSAETLTRMLNAAIDESDLTAAERDSWAELAARSRKLVVKRGALAHSQASGFLMWEDDKPAFEVADLRRPHAKRRTGKKAPAETQRIHDIKAHCSEFLHLADEVARFRHAIHLRRRRSEGKS